jgi:predicted Zn-dependent protease
MSRQAPEHSEEYADLLLQLRQKTSDTLLLERLAETGFMASECGMDLQAEKIFGCMTTMRPGSSFPLISLAIARARRGLMDQAIGELRKLIADRPGSEIAKAVLGTMLVHSRQPGALKLLEEIIAANTDQAAVGIAKGCIDLARTQETEAKGGKSESLEFFRHHNVRP